MFENIHHLADCIAFSVFLIVSIVLCCFLLTVSYFLGGRSWGRNKNIAFESGINPVEMSNNIHVSIKFYLIAMFFVIFDVEALYLYVWSVSIKECGWLGFFEATVFIITLLVGLIYLQRMQALNWTEKFFLKKK